MVLEDSRFLELAADTGMGNLRLGHAEKVESLSEIGGAEFRSCFAGDDIHHRGFTGAIGANDATQFAIVDIQGEIIQRLETIKADGDILQIGSVECMYESDSELPADSTTSTHTDIQLADDVLEFNTRTQNLKPKRWQNDDNKMYFGIKIAIWGLSIVVVALLVWLVVSLLSAPAG